MHVVLKALHMKLTPSLKQYAEEKLRDAVLRVCDQPASTLAIELMELGHTRNKQDKECRVLVYLPHGHTVVISEIDDTMYKAIDLAHDRLMLCVKREREKRQSMSHRRKWAARHRNRTAHNSFTPELEPWEQALRAEETA